MIKLIGLLGMNHHNFSHIFPILNDLFIFHRFIYIEDCWLWLYPSVIINVQLGYWFWYPKQMYLLV